VAWYGSLTGGIVIDVPAQSVRMPPGSRTVTLMPSGHVRRQGDVGVRLNAFRGAVAEPAAGLTG
jgi:hypothetical protein